MRIPLRLFFGVLCALAITSCGSASGTAGRTVDAFFRTFGLVSKVDVPASDSDDAVLQRGQTIQQRGTHGLPASAPATSTVVQR